VIGRIAGRLELVADDHVLIDVGGVGYVVHVSDRTRAGLPGPGEALALFTELLVRDDALQLVGFTSMAEKEWHRLLMSVQGVGAKAAMAILGALGADGVARSIALGDAAAIRAAPGVGPKLAQRVTNELRDKAPAAMSMPLVEPVAGPAGAVARPDSAGGGGNGSASARAEAMSALANLGYAPAEAAKAVAEAMDDAPEAETAHLIRLALRRLAPGGG